MTLLLINFGLLIFAAFGSEIHWSVCAFLLGLLVAFNSWLIWIVFYAH